MHLSSSLKTCIMLNKLDDTSHDEEILDAKNNCRTVYADKSYVDCVREERLTGQGLNIQIQRKGAQDKLISEALPLHRLLRVDTKTCPRYAAPARVY